MTNEDTITIVTTVGDINSLINAYNEDSDDTVVEQFFENLMNILTDAGDGVVVPLNFMVRVDGSQHDFVVDDE